MPDEDLDQTFREGRLTRRAYVRQIIEGGSDLQSALARAESIAPSASLATPMSPSPVVGPVTLSERPRHVDNLEVNFVGDGYIVYDRARRRMHSLNATAALVFELCTGSHDVVEMAALLQHQYSLDAPPTAEVTECLATLSSEHLIR